MNRTVCAILTVAIAFLQREALGFFVTFNQPLHHAIYAGHDPKLIVAGQIVAKEVKPLPPAVMGPDDVNFRFKVTTVILGQQTYKHQTLLIPATSFLWPTELLAFQEGVQCALVLRTDWGDKRDGYYLCSVVPVSSATLPTAKDGEEAKRILSAELLTELKAETSANRQRQLILQISPILLKAQSEALVPYLKSDDIWLRRASLAGLLAATRDTNYLSMAYRDIQQFIRTMAPAFITKEGERRPQSPPYPRLFAYYFFLEAGWGQDEDEAEATYLPLFRLLAHSSELPEWTRWEHGVLPLCRIGTRDDAVFLYQYCGDRSGKEKQELLRSPSNRQMIFVGISRILALGLLNWHESNFLSKEREEHRQISEALVREGIINAGQVHDHPVPTVQGDGKPAPQP